MKFLLVPATLMLLAIPVSQATLRYVAAKSDLSQELISKASKPQIYGRFQLHNPSDSTE